MRFFAFLVLSTWVLSAMADVYLANPRGSNNRYVRLLTSLFLAAFSHSYRVDSHCVSLSFAGTASRHSLQPQG